MGDAERGRLREPKRKGFLALNTPSFERTFWLTAKRRHVCVHVCVCLCVLMCVCVCACVSVSAYVCDAQGRQRQTGRYNIA